MPTESNDPPIDRWPAFYRRCATLILSGYLLLAPAYLLISAKVLTPGDMSAYLLDVGHWLPQDKHLLADMEKFSTVAGYDRGRVIRISWPNCTEDDPRLKTFAAVIAKATWPAGFQDESLTGSVFVDVLTLDDLYNKMHSASPGLSRQQIYDQLKSIMIGDDGTTCIIATLTTSLPAPRAHAIKQLYAAAASVDNLDESDLRLFGGAVYTSQLDKSGANIATTFTPFSVLISLICAWFCIGRWRVLLALFLNALLATCMALVSVYFSDVTMDPVLMLMPGFWMIMMLSGGVHFINYYFEIQQKQETDYRSLAGTAAKVAFQPAFLATLTTCIGLASLCTSDVMPVFRFGLQSAIGLACAFVSQFLFLPSFLHVFNVGATNDSDRGAAFWLWYERFAVGFRYKTSIVFLLLIVFGAYGFTHLGFSNRLKDQFASDLRINTDTDWFEQKIGPLIPFEILVRFPKENLPKPSQCLGYIDTLQQRLENLDEPLKLLSSTAIVPYDAGTGARQTMRRAILDKKLENQRQTLLNTGYVLDETDFELWRISAFAFSSGKVSMSDYFAAINQAATQFQSESQGIETKISYAGLGARMAVITQRLGGGLLKSSLTSAILISLVVIIALRSWVLGLTAMLPNMFPVLISFGAFGYFNPTLDIGAIMTASIAMGIAVDDTIHFMYWFRKGVNSNLSRENAIQLAIKKSGRAIAATSVICGLGFCVYFFCDFMPIARFGQLLFLMLGAALVGDLFFLPALLRSLPERWLSQTKPELRPEPSAKN